MAYWLFKTEPAEYGIGNLEAESTARWDGIRNYQARNNLRDRVAVGDLVLIYHSSCKIPGVAGIAEVVRTAYPDPSQFDSDSPGWDDRATPEQPRWFCVDIAHRHTFPSVIAASSLKNRPELRDMVLFRQGRLSVQPVTDKEWQTILSLAGRTLK